MSDAQERFRNIRLQVEYDTHDPKGHCSMVLSFLKKRSKIIEIVAAHDIVFALAQSGVCAAFSRETNQRICFLNVSPDEVIRSLFYNKNNDSLITVSVYASDNFSSLKCRTTRIEYIKRGKPDAGFPLFESESLKWPGFVEFDDVNGKVLTYSAQDSIYKVFDLKNYTMLYSISDKNVQEIKISPGIMLLIFTKACGHVPLKILSIEDGTVLKTFNHLLHRNKKVDFIEQFNEKLLVKQENENLQILDVRNSELTEVSRTEFMTPSAFIFLYENQLFLTFRNRTVAVWNFRGELVTSFEDHLLWHPDCNTNNIYITSDQDLIISYCKADSDDSLAEGNAGSINISNILTGKCLAKIRASSSLPIDKCCCSGCFSGRSCSSKKRIRASRLRSTAAEALEDITALFYDEERNEIYTGNRHGLVHVCFLSSKLAEMEDAIDGNAPLDYAEFQLFPSHDRYEACVCSGNKIETIASGLLGQLVLHSPEIKDLSSRGSNANFKLQPPKSLDSRQWFTKSTLTRFLHLVGSPDILNSAKAIDDEITQLEEARKFHLTLYTKDNCDHSGDGKRDGSNSTAVGPKLKDEVKIASSDASKNELLRAMELRLKALRGELAAAFNRATVATCSSKHIFDMEKLSQHFGAIDLRNTLRKFVEHCQMDQNVDLPSDEKSPSTVDSRNDRYSATKANAQILKPSLPDTQVKYGVSPAKAAQVERQSSTESEESSASTDDDQPTVERSRTLIRSASPRRSASPMRRVQIGRSGSRRATALNIKSLNYFPARDKTFSNRDAAANSSEDEGLEHPPKRSDSNVRISVQDAISLFENKQKDQTLDAQKRRSTLDAFPGTKKSVLRRWSAGTGESSTQDNPQIASENSVQITSDHSEAGEIRRSSLEEKDEPEFFAGDNHPVEAAKMDEHLDTFEERTSNPVVNQAETLVIQTEEKTEKLTASAEWNRQKELELNQMLRKMMECKPVRYQNIAPDSNRSQDVPCGRRGGVSDRYKEKRDKKLRGDTAGRLAEKEAQPRAMQQILGQRKTEMTSASKSSLAKPQKSHKTVTQSVNPKKEISKPAVTKKALAKTSPAPAMRKSWSTTPSPRATTGTSPAKTPCGTPSTGTTPTRRRPQPTPSVPRSSPKEEISIQQPKNVKARPNVTKKSMKDMTEKKQQPSTKNGKTVKTKVQTPPGKDGSVVASKPSFYSKVTKKSSVVPLESKPFLRKGTGIGPGVGPVVIKSKEFPQPEETSENPKNLSKAQKNEVITDSSGIVSQQQEEEEFEAVDTDAGLEPETHELSSQQKCEETVSSEQVAADFDDSFIMVREAVLKTEVEEETVISPTAWVEIEEHQDLPIPLGENRCEISYAANVAPVAISSPRIRHSLSQMLLEESAETDILEWGNAENPAAMVYQKDAPKGLKRLLKFARKSKADPNLTGWSSPPVFSEGEDDVEDSKAVSKKNADNLRRMAALHGKNCGQPKASLGESYEKDLAGPEIHSAHSNVSKFSAQRESHKLQDHISTAANTSKATRSFFSLSAFRGSKPNETKLR
ncbi:hypothetical protein RHMOL_Rhmol03G0180200 [Rhododendron molle]|uniref:Uncharacterized protein n=1 Tax=Rhododendron molle TaxID=49168 RepID=A0ACC0PG47_RHOML|nr:hypothetical protein RHMOL_Rhmol03G0180200 [Rhododendron molle]